MERKIQFIDLHHDLANYFTESRELLKMPYKDFTKHDTSIRHGDLPSYKSVGTKALFATVFPLDVDGEKIVLKNPKKRIEEDYNVYKKLFKDGLFRQIKTSTDLEMDSNKIGLILHMEGAEAIEDLKELDKLWNMGVRSVGLTWNYENDFAGGCNAKCGVTEKGKDLLKVMRRKGFILDVTHLNRRSFKETLDIWDGPVMASHTSLDSFYKHDQNLENWQIEKVIERGGLVGMSFFGAFYGGMNIKMDILIDELSYIKKNFGVDNIAIGTDFFGFGLGESLVELSNVASLPVLADRLKGKSWTDTEIDKLFFRNAYEFLHKSLPK